MKRSNKKVHKVMHEFKHGTLRSGGSGKKVKDRKQAIAIAMSEAGISKSLPDSWRSLHHRLIVMV
jgi:hypothetical protein